MTLTTPTPARQTHCRRGHDLRLPGATKLKSDGAGKRYRLRCQACHLDRLARFRAAKKEEKRLAKNPELLDEDGGTDAARNSPYAVTRKQLEAAWGVPYKHWTLAQHRQHNLAMYRVLGWPEDHHTRPPSHLIVMTPSRRTPR